MGHRQEPPEDCTRCAACCFSESVRHARVTGDDYARLGESAESLVTWVGNEAYMALTELGPGGPGPQRCGALAIDAELGAFACSIYERRPQVCRDLERGESACRGELATKGDRPRRALTVLRSVSERDRTNR